MLPTKSQVKVKKPASNIRRSVSGTPKLRRTPNPVPDSSTDDLESPQSRVRRPNKNRKTPTKSGQHKVCKKLHVRWLRCLG